MLLPMNRSDARRTSSAKNGSSAPSRVSSQVAPPIVSPRTPPTITLPSSRSAPKLHGSICFKAVDRQRADLAAPHQRTRLEFGQDQERRHERVGNVGGHVQLQPIQPEQRARHQAHEEMEAVERQRADEHPDADRHGVAPRTARLGPEVAHRAPEPTGQRRAACQAGHAISRRPPAAGCRPTRASRCPPPRSGRRPRPGRRS